MHRMYKALPVQVEQYQLRKPCYPLYGYIECKCTDGTKKTCAVELLNQEDNKYEVMAPDGWHFDECGGGNRCCANNLHSLLCINKKDVEERTSGMTLTQCEEES